jgi:hypothetical protein
MDKPCKNFSCEAHRQFSVLCQKCSTSSEVACSTKLPCSLCENEFTEECPKAREK